VRASIVLGLAVWASGCFVEELDLEGRRCPCADGWSCDAARDVCMRDAAPDAGRGMDAAIPDAGRSDAGRDDAGRTDGGSSDAGMDDAGRDGGRRDAGDLDSTSCDDVNFGRVFCDGFESNMSFPEWDGTSTRVDGVTDRETSNVYRGTGAFSAVTSAPDSAAYLSNESLGPYASGTIWARAYLFIPSTPALDLVSVIYAGYDGNDGVAVEISGDEILLYNVLADVDMSGGTIPLDAWFCVEIGVTIGTIGAVVLRVDDVERARLDGDTSSTPGYSILTVGLNWTSSLTNTASVLVDEVVFHTSGPIGCD
jgi:hypothetical protein